MCSLFLNSHLNSVSEPRWQEHESQKASLESETGKGKTKKKKRPEFVHPNYENMCRDEQDFDKCCNYVMYLGNKIVRRGYQVELSEFLNLVNINGFYKGMKQSSSSTSNSATNNTSR